MAELGLLADIKNGLVRFYKLYTPARAGKLDNLDATVGSREAEADAKERYENTINVLAHPYLSTMRTYWTDNVVDVPSGTWVGLRGQSAPLSDPVYRNIVLANPLLVTGFLPGGDLVPAMTSNTAPAGYVASASQAPQPAYNAFDKTDSVWQTNSGTFPGQVGSQWVQVKLPAAAGVGAYALLGINSSGGNPADFKLQGSNDGQNFVDLDVRSGITWAANETKNFFLPAVVSYMYYRLLVTRLSAGTATFLTVRELTLYQYGTAVMLNSYSDTDKTYCYVQAKNITP